MLENGLKDIIGYEGLYKISNNGAIFSIRRNKIMKTFDNNYGYKQVSLVKNGRKKSYKIHRLVAIHFCKKNDRCNVVNHIDLDKKNNSYKNLEWCTHSENSIHFFNSIKGVRSSCAKLSSEKISMIREMNKYSRHFTTRWLGKCFGVSSSTISAILRNARYKGVLG